MKRDIAYCGVRQDKISTASPVLDSSNYNLLVHFITERYSIHLKKDVMKYDAPWTDDPILQTYRFTNVRREQDRQTLYLIKHIVNHPCLSLTEKIINIFLFRAWNNWDTMRLLGGPWSDDWLADPRSLKEYARAMYDLTPDKETRLWYSNAYLQSGSKMAWGNWEEQGYKSQGREPIVVLRPFHFLEWMIKNDTVRNMLKSIDQKQCVDEILKLSGFSTFTAYQVFVDCSYIPEFPYTDREFVMSGPGCHNGLMFLFQSTDGLTDEELLFWLRDRSNINQDINAQQLFADLPGHDRYMNVMSLENCMCELSKYIRTYRGTGKPRNHYKPTEATHD